MATLYSWPYFNDSPWPVHIFVGAAFVLSLLSVRKALKLHCVLRRLGIHHTGNRREAADRIRRQIADKDGQRWIPSRDRQKLWNCPVLYLNLATISLLTGFAWIILAAANDVGFDMSKRESKVTVHKYHMDQPADPSHRLRPVYLQLAQHPFLTIGHLRFWYTPSTSVD